MNDANTHLSIHVHTKAIANAKHTDERAHTHTYTVPNTKIIYTSTKHTLYTRCKHAYTHFQCIYTLHTQTQNTSAQSWNSNESRTPPPSNMGDSAIADPLGFPSTGRKYEKTASNIFRLYSLPHAYPYNSSTQPYTQAQ